MSIEFRVFILISNDCFLVHLIYNFDLPIKKKLSDSEDPLTKKERLVKWQNGGEK
jgi:hypothetical protein